MREAERGFTFIVGNMFGSKTGDMIHLLSLEQNMGRKVQLFKVSWDNRYGESEVVTHTGTRFPAFQVADTELVKIIKPDTTVVGLDEVQFFDERIEDFILKNLDRYLIIATALQMDFRGNPFPLRSIRGKEYDSERHVGHLMPHAKIIARYPQCTHKNNSAYCRADAIYIQRFKPDGTLAPYSDPTVVVGGKEIEGEEKDFYAPRCIEHFVRPKPDVII